MSVAAIWDKLHFRGVFWKIYLAFIITAMAATSVTWSLAAFYREWSNESQNLIAPTGGYISAAELMLKQGGEPLLLEWLRSFDQLPSVNAYVFDGQGMSLLPNVPEAARNYAYAHDVYEARINPLSGSEILVKSPIQNSQGKVYLLVVEFVHPLMVFNLAEYLIAGFLVSLVVFVAWSLLLSGYLTHPVRHMQKTVRDFAQGKWSARMDIKYVRRTDELGELSREFDHMAGYIERLIHDQKQLVGDVSHELRSPLARTSVALELARLDAMPEQEEHLDRIELETKRLNEMIEDLLNMAKLDTQQDYSQWQDVDCNALLHQVVSDAQFERQGSVINLHADSDVRQVEGDPKLLHSAFENIVRNALLHTAEGTSVDISLKMRKNMVRVVIRDHGPGVPADKLEDLLRPFVRAESARQRLNDGHRGFGLGLAIANRVVSHHRGRIRLLNHREGGLMVIIYLPPAPAVINLKTLLQVSD